MTEAMRPETPEQVADAVATAIVQGRPLELTGGGSKRAFGRPCEAEARLDLSALAGIVLYEPEELVLTAKPGTPLAEIESVLAQRRQYLAFEPGDLGLVLDGGGRSRSNIRGTLGGAIACNLAGPRRIKAGAARDHVLGFHAVSGRGERFKAGGRVVKNVTGFDLSKLIAGSFGTLAAITELTVRALPAPEETRTVVVLGLDDAKGVRSDDHGPVEPFRRVRRGAPAGGDRHRIVGDGDRVGRRFGDAAAPGRHGPFRVLPGDGIAARAAGAGSVDDAGHAGKHRRVARGARRRLLRARIRSARSGGCRCHPRRAPRWSNGFSIVWSATPSTTGAAA